MESQRNPSSRSHQTLVVVALIIGLISIVGILFLISLSDLTNRETTLLGTVLTFLSVAIGWGVSHFYATQEKKVAIQEVRDNEQKNLRTFGLKAAEKVTNLSNEINRLASYLREELLYTQYRNAEEELFAKEERIESAIHMLESLRSINDTSLSDWQGVIGQELTEHREAQKEQMETVRELNDRLSALEVGAQYPSALMEIDEIKRQLRALAAEAGGGLKVKSRPNFQTVEAKCPHCGAAMKYGQKTKENDKKALQCQNCKSNLISTYRQATGFSLTLRGVVPESFDCPSCQQSQTIELDEWPSASTTTTCSDCSANIRVSRIEKGGGIRVAIAATQKSPDPLSSDVLDLVEKNLPSQPWPKGVHQQVAEQLSLKPSTVQKAIQQLIRVGKFMDQVDGVICTTEEKIAIMRGVGTKL